LLLFSPASLTNVMMCVCFHKMLQGGARMFGPRAGFSSKDAPAHTMMKSRQEGQDAAGDLSKRDLKAELLERETKHFADKPELLGSRKGPSTSASEASELSRHLPFEESIDVPGIMDNEFAATAVLSTRFVHEASFARAGLHPAVSELKCNCFFLQRRRCRRRLRE